METQSSFEKFDELKITPQVKKILSEIAKWAKFLAILGYVGIFFMLIFSLIMFSLGESLNQYPYSSLPLGMSIILGSLYIIIAAIYFVPVYYFYSFSSKLTTALNNNDQEILSKSFEYLKSHYKFIGILTIITIVIYTLIIGFVFINDIDKIL